MVSEREGLSGGCLAQVSMEVLGVGGSRTVKTGLRHVQCTIGSLPEGNLAGNFLRC